MLKLSKRLIDVTGMRDVIQRRVPVMTLDSGIAGPNVWLVGCVHGDEPGGAAIIHDVFGHVRQAGLTSGALHALPLVNTAGFENVSRYINSDREDLNRCFPGDAEGSVGQRVARKIFSLIEKTKPDLVMDLHNDWIQSVPYVVIEPESGFPTRALRKRTIRLAQGTGLLVVQETETSPVSAHSLAGAMVASGVPSFTVEAGGACGIVESSVAAGKAAVLGALADLGMCEPAQPKPVRSARKSAVLGYTNEPHCGSSGIIRFSVTAGDPVRANQVLGRVYGVFGAVEETLRAAGDGYVLGVSDHARAIPGSEVIAIAEHIESADG